MNANANQQIQISQNELNELLELKKQIELKKQKAVISSQKSRAKRIENMTEEEKELFKEKNRIASKKSNEKKKLEIEEMKKKLALYESQSN